MATRTSSPARKPAAKRTPARKPAAKRAPARRAPSGPGPLAKAASLIGRALRGLWLGIAHLLGGAARRLGHSARDLDPEHRRDGIGLALVGAAVVVAAVAWWNLGGPVGTVVTAVVTGLFGSLDWIVPLLLIALAVRVLRRPDESAATGRIIIGGFALVLSVLGLVHVFHGTPLPPEGADAMRAGGGLLGFVASAPVVAAVGSWIATILLLLVMAFGVLVVTATPVNAVPARLRALRDRVLLRGTPEPVEELADEIDLRDEPRRRHPSVANVEDGDADSELDDEQVAAVTDPKGRRAKRRAAEAAAAAEATALEAKPFDSPVIDGPDSVKPPVDHATVVIDRAAIDAALAAGGGIASGARPAPALKPVTGP